MFLVSFIIVLKQLLLHSQRQALSSSHQCLFVVVVVYFFKMPFLQWCKNDLVIRSIFCRRTSNQFACANQSETSHIYEGILLYLTWDSKFIL